jgi:hypothetical protein
VETVPNRLGFRDGAKEQPGKSVSGWSNLKLLRMPYLAGDDQAQAEIHRFEVQQVAVARQPGATGQVRP